MTDETELLRKKLKTACDALLFAVRHADETMPDSGRTPDCWNAYDVACDALEFAGVPYERIREDRLRRATLDELADEAEKMGFYDAQKPR